jgi:hypothetical protein
MAKIKSVDYSTIENFRTKPRLGNDPILHGKTSVDNAGGANPPAINPSKKKRK